MTARTDALRERLRAAPPAPGAPSSLRPCAVMLGVAAVLCAAWALVPRGATSAVLLLLLNALTVGALLLGVRRFRPGNRSPWLVLVATQACSVVAFALWYLEPVVTGDVLPVPSPADALFLLLYSGNAAAVGLLIRRERSGRDRQSLIDVLIVTAALGALSWVFLMAPYTHAAELSPVGKVVSLAYPALDLVLVVLALRLAISGSRTTPAKALLLGWGAFQLAGDTVYGVMALAGTWTLSSPVMLRSTPAGVFGPRGLAVRCAFEGRDAGAGGLSWRACPYVGGRPYSLRWWLYGYVAGRRLAGLQMPGDGERAEQLASARSPSRGQRHERTLAAHAP